jgi:hypothetical protein
LPLELDLHCQYDQVSERGQNKEYGKKKFTSEITFTFHLHPAAWSFSEGYAFVGYQVG